jgi:eukaryotic-like serine/threonine-protein kinase
VWNNNTAGNKTHDGALTPGQMLGRYELLSPIAAGGMGNVWAARLKGTRGFRKLVAIKTILQSFEDEKLEQMLYQEATLASQIHHPHVVETLELGEHQGILYLVMELIQGESLSCLMRESVRLGGLPLNVSVNLIAQVCRGLAAAHDLRDGEGNPIGLVHRDISPPNILVTYSGTVKIVDFGVATTSSSVTAGSGEIKGKISYLAPEQLRGEPLDGRVDVFATGVVLYLLTVGRHPFKGPTEAQTIARILGDTRPTAPSSSVPGYPEALERVVLRALEKDPNQRYRSANEFLNALHHALPEAFGPESETEVADCVGELLSRRMQERRMVLREAEESTERSSRPTASSVPVTVATQQPPAKSANRAAFALSGALVALGVAAGIGSLPRARAVLDDTSTATAEKDSGSRGRIAAATVLAGQVRELPTTLQATAPGAANRAEPATQAADAARGAPLDSQKPSFTTATAPATAPPLDDPAASASLVSLRRTARATRAGQRGASKDGELDPVALIDSGLQGLEPGPETTTADVAEEDPASTLPPSIEVPSEVAVPSFVAAVMVPKAPSSTKNSGPRMLGSRAAHGRLTINPMADAYRVKVPPALANMGRSFTATVRICVSPRGSVTGVNILRSAGAGIDALIPSALGRWRYSPLNEGGENVPFCYVLVYEVAGR